MKTKPILCLSALLCSTLAWADPSEVQEREISVPKCSHPVAKVIVSEIKCKSADCGSGAGQQDPNRYRWWERSGQATHVRQPSYTGVGTGMTDMLATALSQTGCFEIMERGALDEINQELALVGKRVAAESADFMVVGAITSLGFEQSSNSLGAFSHYLKGPLSMIAGGVDYKKSKVHMNMDIKIVDVNRAKMLSSKTFQADNQRTGFGVAATGWGGSGGGLGGNSASISGSPLEEVARDLLVRSTSFVTESLASKNITERVTLQAQAPQNK